MTEKNKQFKKASPEELQTKLSLLQYKVTMESATEKPFDNTYNETKQPGLYVDITTGEPLFSSDKKFDSGCGWPSFTAPLEKDLIDEKDDFSNNKHRIEVRSNLGDAHLGHVFTDGPPEEGGLRHRRLSGRDGHRPRPCDCLPHHADGEGLSG